MPVVTEVLLIAAAEAALRPLCLILMKSSLQVIRAFSSEID